MRAREHAGLRRPGQPGPAGSVRLRRLEPFVRRALRGPCRLPSGETLLVAVSGGADSTALLVALASLGREFGLALHAAHLHHGLRGREADADLVHVRELCERFEIPLTTARWDCRARMRRRGLSGEAGLRTLRREWLDGVARRVGASAIATAHSADDQLETLLMRLARGTGLAGAGGMRARHGVWMKPLLAVTRADIEADLRRHGVTWREDASNAAPDHLRNRIRHVAIPALLDALGVAPADPVSRRAELARRVTAHATELADARTTLERAAERVLARARVGADHDARVLAHLPPAVLRLALRRAWSASGAPSNPGLTARQLAPLLEAVAGSRGRADTRVEVALPGGWRAEVRAGRLRFARLSAVPDGEDRAAGERASRGVRQAVDADARLLGNRKPPGSGRPAPLSRRSTNPAAARRGRQAVRPPVPQERT